jgi:hypothetical protein
MRLRVRPRQVVAQPREWRVKKVYKFAATTAKTRNPASGTRPVALLLHGNIDVGARNDYPYIRVASARPKGLSPQLVTADARRLV